MLSGSVVAATLLRVRLSNFSPLLLAVFRATRLRILPAVRTQDTDQSKVWKQAPQCSGVYWPNVVQ